MKADEQKGDYLGVLDGVRGLMALWVFYGHLLMDVTGKFPRLGPPALAVDVFMFLSGFLMMYHWRLRQQKFNSPTNQVSDFYIRRFFRIAPLYYLLLITALLVQNYVIEAREFIDHAVPPPWAAQQAQSISPIDRSITIASVIAHLTFLFGFIPKYAANNALPDWSIGLEMQFYLFLLILVFVLDRVGSFSLALGSLASVYLTSKLFGLYLATGPLGSFPQPTLIFFKLNIFVAGMCLAQGYLFKRETRCLLWLISGAVAMIGLAQQVIFFVAAMMLLLFFDGGKAQKEIVHRALSGNVARFLGDTSYSVYLLHNLLLIPIVYLFLQQNWFLQLGDNPRLAIVLVVVGIPVYGIAYFLHKLIEMPGIEIGRSILSKMGARRALVPASTLGERHGH